MKEKKKEKGLVGWVATISVDVAWGDLIYTFKTQSFPRTNLTIDGFDTREEAIYDCIRSLAKQNEGFFEKMPKDMRKEWIKMLTKEETK